MLQIRRILCPVDFSDASRHALTHAVTVAQWFGAGITALHVRSAGMFVNPPIILAAAHTTSEATRMVHVVTLIGNLACDRCKHAAACCRASR